MPAEGGFCEAFCKFWFHGDKIEFLRAVGDDGVEFHTAAIGVWQPDPRLIETPLGSAQATGAGAAEGRAGSATRGRRVRRLRSRTNRRAQLGKL